MTVRRTHAVVDALSADGAEVRFVGGCVRDAVTGREVRDIDLATADRPEAVLALLARAGIRAVPTGIDHGTITAVEDGHPFEITTLRVDVETDGRRAVVAYTDDWEADASRRDLTINALSCDPAGGLYDYFGGLADARAGRVRFVGDPVVRIKEDVLRILRFYRFHGEHGRTDPDPAARAAAGQLADRLPALSGERVQAELLRILANDRAAEILDLMVADGVIAHLLPALTDVPGLSRLIEIEGAAGIDGEPIRRLATALEGDEATAAAVADRLRLSNADTEKLRRLVGWRDVFSPAADGPARRRWFYRHGASLYGDLALLHAARHDVPADRMRADIEAAAAWNDPSLPISGADVVARGVPEGPAVGAVLTEVETWWIDRDFEPDRPACLAALDEIVERMSGQSGTGRQQ